MTKLNRFEARVIAKGLSYDELHDKLVEYKNSDDCHEVEIEVFEQELNYRTNLI